MAPSSDAATSTASGTATATVGAGDPERVALAEIELCGELIIAASAVEEERLSADRIDEVLRVGVPGPR
ncbi:hypothetical protein ABZV60_02805 [Streptomyces sp. NPDC004787]|uniref:hypothetical protein n=1 Tax=Streptomyces sp. NPDC004787 TaxID=3154291 RepID=UPI0033A6E4B1